MKNVFAGNTNKRTPVNVSVAEYRDFHIYDATGRLVKDIRLTPDAVRPTQISWDGRDDSGKNLPTGVYFLKLGARDYFVTKTLLLIR